MSRKLATIQTIKELLPIPNADAIELATFENIGWKCVVKKGEFKPKDKAVYFEIDSLLPLIPEFEFLAKGNSPKKTLLEDGTTVEGYKLKTVKLRGQLSQGLALPLQHFNNYLKNKISIQKNSFSIDSTSNFRITIVKDRITLKIPEQCLEDDLFLFYISALDLIEEHKNDESTFRGSLNAFLKSKGEETINKDVSTYLDIYKYEAPISPQLAGQVKGNFPSFIPKTDEERIQTCWNIIQKYKDLDWYASIKYDGTSATFYNHEGVFGVCSRNLDLKETEGNIYWQIANKFDLKNNLPDGFAIQGEIYGEGMEKNPHKIKGVDFVVFNVYSILEGKYLDYREAVDFVEGIGLQFVKCIEVSNETTLNGKTMDDFLAAADLTGLEGLVYRPVKEVTDPRFGRVSFKVISNNYLLKENA